MYRRIFDKTSMQLGSLRNPTTENKNVNCNGSLPTWFNWFKRVVCIRLNQTAYVQHVIYGNNIKEVMNG